ncbi:hypothetical protein [Bradyrhizobium neotropicale]|uniref:hypothetical protein n=1 Tax=Bradyrhizobium neotropicale TaxID=1497615 RepID=UPI0009ED8EF9|nr:hypothetical protein [Bradyrhizobium neotropicale]
MTVDRERRNFVAAAASTAVLASTPVLAQGNPPSQGNQPTGARATRTLKGDSMRYLAFALSIAALVATNSAVGAQACKVCAEQHKACMKNYAGPACKTEYRMCLKSCKSK